MQIGTAFAFCEESGLNSELKCDVLARSAAGTTSLFTDSRASPTGMPFKVVGVPCAVSEPAAYAERKRICDLGYQRQPYQKSDGSIGYRCPAEPIEDFIAKGGPRADAEGRKCLCNGLFAAAGLGQALSEGATESAIITAGADVAEIARLVAPGRETYRAVDVLNSVLNEQ